MADEGVKNDLPCVDTENSAENDNQNPSDMSETVPDDANSLKRSLGEDESGQPASKKQATEGAFPRYVAGLRLLP